ncbi:MAG: hypothetical protein HYU41_21315 [Candidatus Rokubacteria bacterium]|nr:hypothetical protein [Candidatus Rokubacteria bacterium]
MAITDRAYVRPTASFTASLMWTLPCCPASGAAGARPTGYYGGPDARGASERR